MNRLAIFMAAGLMAGSAAWGQAFEKEKFAQTPTDWEISAITGYFTGGEVWNGRVDGVPAKADTDGGFLVGVRFGADQEYLGWEVGVSGVFEDMELEHDPSDIGLPSPSETRWLLGNVNALWYPFGNDIAEGRVRPFFTAGPGVAGFFSDLDQVDGEAAFDVNVGLGVKLLLGEQKNPVLRFDYRWHYMTATTGELKDNIFRQEITVGLGIRF
jgi:hypothetical protein